MKSELERKGKGERSQERKNRTEAKGQTKESLTPVGQEREKGNKKQVKNLLEAQTSFGKIEMKLKPG